MKELPPDNDTQGLGKFMAIIAWVLILVLLSLFFNHWYSNLATTPEIVTTDGTQQTIIKRNNKNQYLTEGTINGKAAVFLLDTGSTDIVIPGQIARELHLQHGYESLATTAGGNIVVYQTYLDTVTIGHITLHHLPASVNANMGGNEILLGMTALKRINFFQQGENLILTTPTPSR
ncbi:MAG: TIGR02281 family clan AA aspartic protease [Candidatus Berkiellales bacterium]